jgi:hypothetical protein
MNFLTPELRSELRANDISRRAGEAKDKRFDPVPGVKLFNPIGAATWLATELSEDGDTLFGLADLGFGCPELGYFSLSELRAVRLPYGLGIERDVSFDTRVPLSIWAETARRAGSILWAETLLRRAEQTGPDPHFPIRSGDPDGG